MTVNFSKGRQAITYPITSLKEGVEFNVYFEFLKFDENLEVRIKKPGEKSVALTLDVDYRVEITAGTNGVWGKVVMLKDIDNVVSLSILRAIPKSQDQSFLAHTFVGENIERAVDKLTMLAQDCDYRKYSLHADETEVISDDDLKLPSKEKLAGSILAFDEQGRPIATKLMDIGVMESVSAGENVTITAEGVISAADTVYTAGENVSINAAAKVISAKDTVLKAGRNIIIEGEYISATTDAEGEAERAIVVELATNIVQIDIADVAYDGLYYVIASERTDANFGCLGAFSSDGRHWFLMDYSRETLQKRTQRLISFGSGGRFLALTTHSDFSSEGTLALVSNNYKVAGGSPCSSFTSTPMEKVYLNRTSFSALPWVDVCEGGGYLIAINSGSMEARSSSFQSGSMKIARSRVGDQDGKVWTYSDFEQGVIASQDQSWVSIAYGAGKFVMVRRNSSRALYSDDFGVTWRETSLPSNSDWTCITYGNEKGFVVVANNSDKAAFSRTGITWTEVELNARANYCSVAYCGGVFVALTKADAGSGYTMIHTHSFDGHNWRPLVFKMTGTPSIVAGDNRLLAVSAIGDDNLVEIIPIKTVTVQKHYAGDNIVIHPDGRIDAVIPEGKLPTAGGGIDVSTDTPGTAVISVKTGANTAIDSTGALTATDTKYYAGYGLTTDFIDGRNVISWLGEPSTTEKIIEATGVMIPYPFTKQDTYITSSTDADRSISVVTLPSDLSDQPRQYILYEIGDTSLTTKILPGVLSDTIDAKKIAVANVKHPTQDLYQTWVAYKTSNDSPMKVYITNKNQDSSSHQIDFTPIFEIPLISGGYITKIIPIETGKVLIVSSDFVVIEMNYDGVRWLPVGGFTPPGHPKHKLGTVIDAIALGNLLCLMTDRKVYKIDMAGTDRYVPWDITLPQTQLNRKLAIVGNKVWVFTSRLSVAFRLNQDYWEGVSVDTSSVVYHDVAAVAFLPENYNNKHRGAILALCKTDQGNRELHVSYTEGRNYELVFGGDYEQREMEDIVLFGLGFEGAVIGTVGISQLRSRFLEENFKKASIKTVYLTLGVSVDWNESGGIWTLRMPVEGIEESDEVFLDLRIMWDGNVAAQKTSFSLIDEVNVENGAVEFMACERPTTALNVKLLIMRKA